MRSAVVTGATGFLGRSLIAELRRNNIRVLAVARKHKGSYDDQGIEHITLDLSQLDKLPYMTKPCWDVFYHFAWEGTSVEERKDFDMQIRNVQYTVQAVKVAGLLGCSKFIGAGSIMEKEVLASSLQAGLRPSTAHIYSSSKLAAHLMSECVAAEIGISHIWAIITNAYGEGEISSRLINSSIRKILKGEEVYFTAGTHYYDFIHVQDAVKALMLLGEKGMPFREYVIGSGHARPLKEFLLEMQSILSPDKEFVFGKIPFKNAPLPLEAFDIKPLVDDTGFKPEISFAEGIKRTAEWLMKHER